MSEYIRPSLPRQVFYDSAGAVIDYGNRWRGESPPENAYSVESNLERFAPVHLVAQALIDHLAANYAVSVSEDVAFADDLLYKPDHVERAIRVVPVNGDQAALTFVFTSYPSVILHAGLLYEAPYPQCGCDACDETAESAADELESTVLKVVAGGLAERVNPGSDLSIGYELWSADGSRGARGETGHSDLSPAWLEQARERLRRLPGRWQRWSPPGAACIVPREDRPIIRLQPGEARPARPGNWAAWPAPSALPDQP
jgi:hypothetical protein